MLNGSEWVLQVTVYICLHRICHRGRAAEITLVQTQQANFSGDFQSLRLWCLFRTMSLVFSKFSLFSLRGSCFRQVFVICLKSKLIAKQRHCWHVLQQKPHLVGMSILPVNRNRMTHLTVNHSSLYYATRGFKETRRASASVQARKSFIWNHKDVIQNWDESITGRDLNV